MKWMLVMILLSSHESWHRIYDFKWECENDRRIYLQDKEFIVAQCRDIDIETEVKRLQGWG